MTTATHSVCPKTGRGLCYITARPVPEVGQATAVALSATGMALEVHRKAEGFELRAEGVPVEDWADTFGVNPYRPGRVALAQHGIHSAWTGSMGRMQQA